MERSFKVVRDDCRKFPNVEVRPPERATANSCGYDFYSNEDYDLEPGQNHLFWTDIKAEMFFDNRLEINVRSGDGRKRKIRLLNTIGWVDADYANCVDNDGNIGFCLENNGTSVWTVKVGDAIGQGCFNRYLITSDDKFRNNKADGVRTGGFGSTTKGAI